MPSLPRLTLRVAFAGTRTLDAARTRFLDTSLERALHLMGAELCSAITHGATSVRGVSRFYDRGSPPLLRLVTGLAEGADVIAHRVALRYASDRESTGVDAEVAAVLPCDLAAYRDSREPGFAQTFDRCAEACRYIVALDGVCDKPTPDTPLAQQRRSRAYRAQATVILRHADLLIAATDPLQPARAGGTMETVRAALDRDVPVLLIDIERQRIRLLEPFQDLHIALGAEPPDDVQLANRLHDVLGRILVDPDEHRPVATSHDDASSPGERLLEEYFHRPELPPVARDASGSVRRIPTHRERIWRWFESRFQRDRTALAGDPSLPPVLTWRSRATELTYHYAGLYRGAYLVNYALALLAVTFAGSSLVLLVFQASAAAAASHGGANPMLVVLLLLATIKLALVVTIARNTHQANHGDWNDRMVDYRYLAERLRAMYYLPLLASFDPPSAAPPQYAARVVRQSAVDWLLAAILRAIQPGDFATPEMMRGRDGADRQVRVLRPDALAAARRLHDGWIQQQATYHDRSARSMNALHGFLDRWGRRLSVAVIAFVAIDIGLTMGELLHVFPASVAHAVTTLIPFLVLMAAVLPAAVSSLNAVRFQSECRRLADRSAVIRTILRGRDPARPGGRLLAAQQLIAQIEQAQGNPATDPASWVAESLRLTETVARDFAEEAGEWSVLYAKELPEP